RPHDPRARVRDAGPPARAGRGRAPPAADRRHRDLRRDATRARAGARRRCDRGIHRRPRRGDTRVEEAGRRREPSREPRPAEAVARQGGTRRTGLRGARGRESRSRAGARAPPHAAARALGAARAQRGRRRRGARVGADSARRGRPARSGMMRLDSPRVVAYTCLAAFGLVAGLVLGRVELVALAAPFALAAVVGAALARDPELVATIALDRERALEGEEVRATLELSSSPGADRVDLFLPLPEELSGR